MLKTIVIVVTVVGLCLTGPSPSHAVERTTDFVFKTFEKIAGRSTAYKRDVVQLQHTIDQAQARMQEIRTQLDQAQAAGDEVAQAKQRANLMVERARYLRAHAARMKLAQENFRASRKTAKRAKPAAAPKAAKSQPTVDQFTQIVATYDELGLQSYLRALVRDAGSRIFIADMEQKELLAAVSLEDEEIHAPGSFAGLAVGRPRIVDDPEAKAYLTQARQQFGPGNYSLIVLFPQRVEEWLVRELGQKSRQAGINPTTLLRFEGKYQMKGQQLVLVITRAVQREGQQIPLSVRLHFKDGPKEVTRG